MKPVLTKISRKHKNSKFLYYSLNFARQFVPRSFFQEQLNKRLHHLSKFDLEYIKYRVNYYNKLHDKCALPTSVHPLKDFKLIKKHKTYFFDTFEYTRFFPDNYRIDFTFGDITAIPPVPSVVKSRPISGENNNAVIMKLNKVRHFTFTADTKKFSKKKNILVGRMNVNQEQRLRFLDIYFNHPLCNVGQINEKGGNPKYLVNYLSIDEHLDYKFILCIEGHDVASNLKWVMSSNSVAVMPRPKYETWFMEGTLIPNYHYIEIKDDYSDLEEKLQYYIRHPEEAEKISKNANEYVEQFKDKKRENLISLLVLERYCHMTGQKEMNRSVMKVFENNSLKAV